MGSISTRSVNPSLMRYLAVVAVSVLASSACAPGFSARWSATAGLGQPTELFDYVGISPRAFGSVTIRLTQAADLGLAGDYAWYNSRDPAEGGRQWRALALVRWASRPRWLPPWCSPFGELGLGLGRLEYVGLTRVERRVGPASRLAVGLDLHVRPRVDLVATIGLDRLDSSINSMERKYPTMVSLKLGLALRLPRGEPLFAPVMPPQGATSRVPSSGI